jgi:predicted aldo/keto reductase-like oxidoreductase
MHRRDFIKTAAATALVMSLGKRIAAAATGSMPYRVLGASGEKVSLLGIGGSHIAKRWVSEEVGVQIVRSALDAGVNFLDNGSSYNGGMSEERMGRALKDGYRAKAFLMTKINGRTAEAATAELDQSLRRMKVDHVDLIQMHDIHRMDEPEQVFGEGGAIEALLAAKKAGKVRYIGFTGHKSPDIHLHMLDVAEQHNFVFNSVQMPLNLMDAHFNSFGQKVLPVLVKKNIGVLGMKSMGDKSILQSNTVTPVECLKFAMNLPVSVCIAGCDSMEILNQGLSVATNFQQLSEGEVTAMLTKTELAAADGAFEPYKTRWRQ